VNQQLNISDCSGLFKIIVTNYLLLLFADNPDLHIIGTHTTMAVPKEVRLEDVFAIPLHQLEVAPFPYCQNPSPPGPYLEIAVRKLAATAPEGSPAPMPKQCSSCKTDDACVAVVPCGHIELCGPCGIRVRDTTNACPVCQGGAYDKEKKVILMRVY
jgi:Zinc finger, C3HC4 type (RING finger)